MALHEIVRADARVLLIGDQRQQYATGHAPASQLGSGPHDCGRAAFHVISAAAIDATILASWFERRVHTFGADSIEVRAEDHGRTVAIADLSHGIRSPG